GVLSGEFFGTTPATIDSPVGSYPITLTTGSLSASNYSFSFVEGTLTVGRATLTVTADDVSRAYGATNPVFTVSYSGFLDGDDTNVVSGAPAFSTTADTNSAVDGSPYSITVSNGTLSASNYDLAFVDGQLTVTQAMLTVRADDQSKVYGAAVPMLTASYSGLVNGEDTNVLAGSTELSTSATEASPVGVYPITVGVGSLSASNYSFSVVEGGMSVV